MTTKRRSRENPAVRGFILQNVEQNQGTIASLTASQFGLSRSAANNYLKRLLDQGLLSASGKTNTRKYSLKEISDNLATVQITPGLAEHDVWRTNMEPFLKEVPKNIGDICYYGFTEMFNNVIDHSGSPHAFIGYKQTCNTIWMMVADQGIGIFEKIQKDFGLNDPRTALLELSKGKLTSDKAHHSGEGIFFTSRMFNSFRILSGNLAYRRVKEDDWAWLIETEDLFDPTKGTTVSMEIRTDAKWEMQEVFQRYEGEELFFAKTHVPIKLGKYGNEQLVSRSQAKRILARFDRFEEIFLDFQGVEEIGQAFADEIFRVFKLDHPTIKITTINASPAVQRMIAHVGGAPPSLNAFARALIEEKKDQA